MDESRLFFILIKNRASHSDHGQSDMCFVYTIYVSIHFYLKCEFRQSRNSTPPMFSKFRLYSVRLVSMDESSQQAESASNYSTIIQSQLATGVTSYFTKSNDMDNASHHPALRLDRLIRRLTFTDSRTSHCNDQ